MKLPAPYDSLEWRITKRFIQSLSFSPPNSFSERRLVFNKSFRITSPSFISPCLPETWPWGKPASVHCSLHTQLYRTCSPFQHLHYDHYKTIRTENCQKFEFKREKDLKTYVHARRIVILNHYCLKIETSIVWTKPKGHENLKMRSNWDFCRMMS